MGVEGGYSGSQESGLNTKGTYQRVYYVHPKVLTTQQDLYGSLQDAHTTFLGHRNTRFVYEGTIDPRIVTKTVRDLNSHGGVIGNTQLSGLIEQGDGTITLKFEDNKPGRKVLGLGKNTIQQTVAAIEEDISREFNMERSLMNIQQQSNKGYIFDINPTAEQLRELRKGVFPYRNLKKLSAGLANGSFYAIAVKNRKGEVVSCAILDKDSGETSERATLPAHQGQGLMKSALLVMHAYAKSQGFNKKIRCDARYNISTKTGKSIGMTGSKLIKNFIPIQHNHVSISGVNDTVDFWNKGLVGLLDEREGLYNKDLKSFYVMYESQEMSHSRIVDTILKTANIYNRKLIV